MTLPVFYRRLAIAGVVTLGASLSAPSALAAQTGQLEVSLAQGTQAPPAMLEDLEGHQVQLLDYVQKGKPALLEFWATWCENCKALQPQLDRIHERYGDGVSIVAVAVAVAQTVRRVRSYVADDDPGYPHLWDAEGEAVRAYQAPTTSVIVILDAQGRVAYTGVGRDQDLLGAVARVTGS